MIRVLLNLRLIPVSSLGKLLGSDLNRADIG
jgi:hypothetical protein